MHRTVTIALVCAFSIVAGSRSAAAQTTGWEDRGYINANFGVQSGTTDLTGAKTMTIYEESAAVAATSTFKGPALFDVSAGVRVWHNVSVGVAYHQGSDTADATIAGTAPHPIFFNQPRKYATTVAGHVRQEQGTHLQFGWMVPISPKMDVLVLAGPTFFRLQQDVVSDVKIVEKGAPFTEVIVTPTTSTIKKSVVGYNVAGDFSYLLWRNDSVRLGAGAFFRYSASTASVRVLNTDQDTTVGGMQFGFGGRLRF